ncbi:unnamed protein product [Amaranthus hypochondriacus]
MGYPPCENPRHCQSSPCCTQGKKYEWPELLGKRGVEAKMIIESENPSLTAVIISKESSTPITDFCCNRVIIFVNSYGSVDIPHPRVS